MGGRDRSSAMLLFEDSSWRNFLPLTYTRTLAQLWCGAMPFAQRVAALADAPPALWCRPYLTETVAAASHGVPVNQPTPDPGADETSLLLAARGLWRRLPAAHHRGPWVGVVEGTPGVACIAADRALVARLAPDVMLDDDRLQEALHGLPREDVSDCVRMYGWPWELIADNGAQLTADLADPTVVASDASTLPSGAYAAQGAAVRDAAVIDTADGPVLIDAGATVHPLAYVEGPAYIGRGSTVLPQSLVRTGTTIGPVCKIGGEVEDAIFLGYSNKQHYGFVGHSIVGNWVNLGAGTTTSDLKSTYGTIRMRIGRDEIDTGSQFLGALIGDHSKTGIATSITAGTTIGFCSAVSVRDCPRFVPSLAWLAPTGITAPQQSAPGAGPAADGSATYQRYDLKRAIAVARRVTSRREVEFTEHDAKLFAEIARLAPQHE